jgi:hypothetical protein
MNPFGAEKGVQRLLEGDSPGWRFVCLFGEGMNRFLKWEIVGSAVR